MTKKMKPMCLSIDPEMHMMLKKKADMKGQKLSDFVRKILGYFSIDRDDIKSVVLQIPQEVLCSRESLDKWLSQKSNSLLNQFFPPVNQP